MDVVMTIEQKELLSYYPNILKKAKQVLHNDAEAEDIAQDIMIAILDGPHLLADVERLGAWLVTMAYRRAIDLIRKKVLRKSKYGQIELSDQEHVAYQIERHELVMKISHEIKRLPADLRLVLVGTLLEEKTYKELSQELKIPMGTLMARRQKALELLKERLEHAGIID